MASFSNQISRTLFVDPTSARFSDNTGPTNGAIYFANPGTGQLLLRIVHVSTWSDPLGAWSAAEEVSAIIRSLPVDERPKQILTQLIDGLAEHLADLRDIVVIRGMQPFRASVRVEKFRDLIADATETKTVLFNLCDDWLASNSPYAVLIRLNLITKAVMANALEAELKNLIL